MIPALVLTAGLATRLRPLSLVRAKAAIPVAGEPLIRRILRWLAGHGVTDAVLNLHHLPHTIAGVVGDGTDGVRVRYSWEVPLLGSAGGPRRALPLLGTSPFLIVNGDTLTTLDVAALVAAHRQSGALVTMAVVPNTAPDKYSGLDVDQDGTVTGVVNRGSSHPSRHFIGVQVAEAEAFASLPDNVPWESVGRLYPSLITLRRASVRTFTTSAEFFDIGSPADYLDTCVRVSATDPNARSIGHRCRIATSAILEDTSVWDDVQIGEKVSLQRCVVTDGARIPDGTTLHRSTVRPADGILVPGERIVGDLAVGTL